MKHKVKRKMVIVKDEDGKPYRVEIVTHFDIKITVGQQEIEFKDSIVSCRKCPIDVLNADVKRDKMEKVVDTVEHTEESVIEWYEEFESGLNAIAKKLDVKSIEVIVGD